MTMSLMSSSAMVVAVVGMDKDGEVLVEVWVCLFPYPHGNRAWSCPHMAF